MVLYVMLTKLTTEGRKSILNNPRRTFEVNKEIEKMGAKVVAQYSLIGPYDFANIIEAPNNEVISYVAATLGARGTLETMTMAAMTMQDFIRGLESAKSKME
ncbi:MAG TPA: GYD domain-containing protein [Dehalococcoidales bacterium]|nr:GYD domain-containing protein [Dehalococcoidales bacterium]